MKGWQVQKRQQPWRWAWRRKDLEQDIQIGCHSRQLRLMSISKISKARKKKMMIAYSRVNGIE